MELFDTTNIILFSVTIAGGVIYMYIEYRKWRKEVKIESEKEKSYKDSTPSLTAPSSITQRQSTLQQSTYLLNANFSASCGHTGCL